MKKLTYLIISIAILACSDKPSTIPEAFTEATDSLSIYPDYTDIIVPANIAPCNFMVQDKACEYVVTLAEMVVGATDDGIVQFDSVAWRNTLAENRGKTLKMCVYSHRTNGWVRHTTSLTVGNEDIDAYLSYRLIEPGYELYRQLGLYQRNLANFDEQVIIENNREYSEDDNHCLNCHNYQNYDTRRMLFHIRAQHGGTVIVRDGKPEKIIIKHDSILGAGVYPTWHPTQDLVVFSSNKTGQVFHQYHRERIEVLDWASDLILYDVEKNQVSNIVHGDNAMETFPCWSPSGDRLFYCEAITNPRPENLPDSLQQQWIATQWDSLHYNIKSMAYDVQNHRFSEPRMEVDLKSQGASASVPRVSPDGRYVLFTRGIYGQFHIWHLDADLWVKDLQTDSCYALTAANSADADSYHSWSSNGRWIVFASRRDDGNFSRVFISYFDKNGQAHKAFMLPQEDPNHNLWRLKSYNVPELTRNAVLSTAADLQHAVYTQEGKTATYVK